ncbi:protein 60A-like [Cotesia typhae]|uniref:protein 60A-like n=1 Tax=Cotesia typhae TaxID=2053667 RepID=UPI003D694F86
MAKLTVVLKILTIVFINCNESAKLTNPKNHPLLEQHLMNLIGLETVPQDSKKYRIEKRSAPIYLMDIYKNTVNQIPGFVYNDTAVDLTNYDFARINQSDVIVSFVAQQANRRGEKPELLRRMWFDVSKINKKHQLISAELRLFRDCSRVTKNSNRRAFVVTVYRISFGNKKRKFIPVNSVVVRANFDGWFSINVTECFRLWMENPERNFGMKVVAEPLGSFTSGTRKKRKVKLEKIGIEGFDGGPERFSFLVGYFKDLSNNDQSLLNQAVEKLYQEGHHGITKRAVKSRPGLCKMTNVYVDFHEIGWDKTILAPPGYEAWDCVGMCKYPVGDFMNGTFHTVIKELYQNYNKNRFDKSHCVPIAYDSMKFLFFSDLNTVVIKNNNDAITTACGCR